MEYYQIKAKVAGSPEGAVAVPPVSQDHDRLRGETGEVALTRPSSCWYLSPYGLS